MALVHENGILCLCALRLFPIPLLSILRFRAEVFHTLSGRGRDSFHRAGPGLLVAFLTLPSKLFNDGLTAFFGRFSLINVFFRNVYLPKTFFGAWPFLMADLTCSHRPPGRCVFYLVFQYISSSHIHDGMRGAKDGIGRCRKHRKDRGKRRNRSPNPKPSDYPQKPDLTKKSLKSIKLHKKQTLISFILFA